MRPHCTSVCSALFAAATLLVVAGDVAAGGLIPSAGEIVRKGTLLDGLCSGKPYPQVSSRRAGAAQRIPPVAAAAG